MTSEAQIRAQAEAGDVDGAITGAIALYGDELFGFLVGLSGDLDQAGDLFSATCVRAWRALAGFRWESGLRPWLYRIARNEFLRAAARRRAHVPLSAVPSVEQAIARVTTTPTYRRPEVLEAFARIRESLDPEDHMLLGLRLDREMAWNDIARVMSADDADDAALTREAAALRKRFERLKARLRELAREAKKS